MDDSRLKDPKIVAICRNADKLKETWSFSDNLWNELNAAFLIGNFCNNLNAEKFKGAGSFSDNILIKCGRRMSRIGVLKDQ